MRNDRKFFVYLLGSKESIEAFNKACALTYMYSYEPTWDFLNKLNLNVDSSEYEASRFNLEEYRKIAREKNNDLAISMLKDENLKKEDFRNIPDFKHFFGILEYKPNTVLKEINNNIYFSKGSGVILDDIDVCFGAEIYSYYVRDYIKVPEKYFHGLCLREFSRMYPDLKIAIVTIMSIGDSTSFMYFSNGGLRVNKSGYTSKESILYDAIPKWFTYDYNGLSEPNAEDIKAKDLSDYSKPYFNEQYVLNKMGLDIEKEEK